MIFLIDKLLFLGKINATYEEMLAIDPEDFSQLAEEVMRFEEEEIPVLDPTIVVPLARS